MNRKSFLFHILNSFSRRIPGWVLVSTPKRARCGMCSDRWRRRKSRGWPCLLGGSSNTFPTAQAINKNIVILVLRRPKLPIHSSGFDMKWMMSVSSSTYFLPPFSLSPSTEDNKPMSTFFCFAILPFERKVFLSWMTSNYHLFQAASQPTMT